MKICSENVALEEQGSIFGNCDENDKLLSVLPTVGMVSRFNGCYIDDTRRMLEDEVPYIVCDGVLKWNVPYTELTVKQFFDTHPQCREQGIDFESGIPAAGGPGHLVGKAAVAVFVKVLEIKYPVLGFTLDTMLILTETVKAFGEYYEEQKISPIQQLDAILNNGEASVLAIEELLNYDEYHARKLLIALGFEKDAVSGKYRIGDKARIDARIKLEHISVEELQYL